MGQQEKIKKNEMLINYNDVMYVVRQLGLIGYNWPKNVQFVHTSNS